MSTNEEHYRMTKAQARRFEESLAELSRQERPSQITPRLWQAQREAPEAQLQELREQVNAYERLHLGESTEFRLEAADQDEAGQREP